MLGNLHSMEKSMDRLPAISNSRSGAANYCQSGPVVLKQSPAFSSTIHVATVFPPHWPLLIQPQSAGKLIVKSTPNRFHICIILAVVLGLAPAVFRGHLPAPRILPRTTLAYNHVPCI